MGRLRRQIGWLVRGGDHTRAELASQAAAIRELQTGLAAVREAVDHQRADGEGLRAEVRGALDDTAVRLRSLNDRLERSGS